MLHNFPDDVSSKNGVIITHLVMTLAKLSAAHKYSIHTIVEGIDDKERIHSPGTHDPDHANIGRILHSCYASGICCRVAAPVAEKTEDSRLECFHTQTFSP